MTKWKMAGVEFKAKVGEGAQLLLALENKFLTFARWR
jgi:hypothetical protein